MCVCNKDAGEKAHAPRSTLTTHRPKGKKGARSALPELLVLHEHVEMVKTREVCEHGQCDTLFPNILILP